MTRRPWARLTLPRPLLALAVVCGLCFGAGLILVDAARAELALSWDGWTRSSRSDPALSLLPVGGLPLRPGVMNLGARQTVEQVVDGGFWEVQVDATLPEGGLLDLGVGMPNTSTSEASLLLAPGRPEVGGGALITWTEDTQTVPGDPSTLRPERRRCTPSKLPEVAPGRHRFEISLGGNPWKIRVDGEEVALCVVNGAMGGLVRLKAGQDRVWIHEVAVIGASGTQTYTFGRWPALVGALLAGPLLLLSLAELGSRLSWGRTLLRAVVGLPALAAPLGLVPWPVLLARAQVHPEIALLLPLWLPLLSALVLVALAPRPAAPPAWAAGATLKLALAGLLATVGLLAVRVPVGALVYGVIALGVVVLQLTGRGARGDGTEGLRAAALASWCLLGGAALGAPWGGQLAAAGGLVAWASLLGTWRARGSTGWRRGYGALLWSALGLVSLELWIDGGPQRQAWVAEPSPVVGCAPTVAEPYPNSQQLVVLGGTPAATGPSRDGEGSFSIVLQQSWDPSLIGVRLQVINQAVAGWGAGEISRCAPVLLPKLDPELVVLYLGQSDLDRYAGSRLDGLADPLAPRSGWQGALLRTGIAGAAHALAHNPVVGGPLRQARDRVLQIADAARAQGARTLLMPEIAFPFVTAGAGYSQMFADIAASREDVELLDLQEVTSGSVNPLLFQDEQRLSLAGRTLVGTTLAAVLAQNPELLQGL